MNMRRWMTIALLVSAAASAQDHPVIKRPVDLPPAAELAYTISARQKGFTLSGEATVTWRAADGKYLVTNETRAAILGKILSNKSEGTIDSFGLAPAIFYEKRFRKDPSTATFDRSAKLLSFVGDKQTYPLLGGEQDRASAQWQLAAVARGAPEKFTPGSEWKFFVAGRRDADVWTFKVLRREKISTGLGEIDTVHLSKAPPADAKGQRLDLWLAPGHEWYPVKLRFSEDDGEFVEQVVSKITKR